MAENSDQTVEPSIFDKRSLRDIYTEIQQVYHSDQRPWVLGYSGGKDSTTCSPINLLCHF